LLKPISKSRKSAPQRLRRVSGLVGVAHALPECANETASAVHDAGEACDMGRTMEIGKRHGLCGVEDAAPAIGSYYKGRLCGSLAEAAGHLAQQPQGSMR